MRIANQEVSFKSLLLVTTEAMLILLALVVGARLRFWNDWEGFATYTARPSFGWSAFVILVTFQACFYYNDLYDLTAVRRMAEAVVRLGQSLGAACLILAFVYFVTPSLLLGNGVVFLTIPVVLTLAACMRVLVDAAWSMTASPQRVLILGHGNLARQVAEQFRRRVDLNVEVKGFVGSQDGPLVSESGETLAEWVGDISDLTDAANLWRIDRIVVALENQRGALPVRELVKLRVGGVRIEDASSAIASLTGRVWIETVRPSWFVYTDGFRRSSFTEAIKRALDLALGLIGLAITAPIMAVTAILIKFDSPGPCLYRQTRVGLGGRTFEVLKFRSMRVDAEAGGAQFAKQGDARVTRLGNVLRKYRLDELPQFINVIRGEMSFVGPRPERPVFVEQFRQVIPYYDERHSVRPGLTGWAQVRYPYGAGVEDTFRKLEYDLFYLQNMSILFDVFIVFETVRTVLFGRGR